MNPNQCSCCRRGGIFVFGSNMEGKHAGGAARHASLHHGAVDGVAMGPTGLSYAVATVDFRIGGVRDRARMLELIGRQLATLSYYAACTPASNFFVTCLGMGVAGFEISDIAPLARCHLWSRHNIWLPTRFLRFLHDDPDRRGWDIESDPALREAVKQ